ncbi:MAG: hypothetical protein A2744_01520 [Candidatus Buchananbacteria bacterium RIFCSPHIGHO2_01_FULL_44_11]|uniref:histidine kinase n=1 Tax=Candidatus Buchananbacteria bacterium RIFCSPHIGHO2_01_FULL_44_11 TaxID=1797535 RepID=A0A1G1XXY7_9BACT|nr:MAG: hypothetical protein A2744_01520 [Candidatus Buchananbacteria bacterium RIFCSPHIGHO2_01_FULL_44_11]
MDLKDILLLLAFILDFALAFFVYRNNRRKELNIVYALMAIWTGLWSLGIAIFRVSQEYQTQLFWNQEFILTAAFIASSFLHFSFIFSDQEVKLKNWQRFLIYVPNLLVLLAIVIPGVMIKDIKIRSWGNESILGWGYIYYGLYFGIVWSWGTIKLIKEYFGASGIFKSQLKYILAGISVSVIFGATFNLIFIIFGNYRYIWLGPYASFIFLLTTTYAIVRYRLMDIRLVFRRIFIYFGVAAFTYGVFYLVAWVYQERLGSVFSRTGYLAGLVIAPIFVAALYGVERLLKIIANKYFFVSLYNYQETINKLANELNYYVDLDEIIGTIVDTIKQAMQLDRAGVLLINQNTNPVHYQIAKVIGFNEKNGISLVQDNFLTQHLQKNQKPLVREELTLLIRNATDKKEQESFKKLYEHMKRIEASLCLPLMSSNKLIGIIVLGSKISKDAYTKEDLDLLDTLSKQAGIAVDNAQLYKEVQDFSQVLQQKVNEQTKDLQAQADHLKKLLQMRSEFLDIASHQLKTPVSVILGTISMFKDGSIQKLPLDQQLKFIDNIFHKAKKLSTIINDILRASEMDTDQFQLIPGNIKLTKPEDILQSIYDELKIGAEEKGLQLTFEKPKKAVGPIIADADFLEQAVYNLVDNAIKYTAKGFVKIVLSQEENRIIIKVSDSGIGIPAADQPKMFDKFSRAKNAVNMYTDGSGLGLFIVKKIVEAHQDGRISFSSEENKGTTFTISLPLSKGK